MMIKELEILLDSYDIEFDAADQRIMCFGHVIDLSLGHVINGLSDKNLPAPTLLDMPSQQLYKEAVIYDPVTLGRSMV
jgi:hypothetical protein